MTTNMFKEFKGIMYTFQEHTQLTEGNKEVS